MAKEKQIPEVDIVVDEAAGVIREVKPEKKLRSKKGHERRINASGTFCPQSPLSFQTGRGSAFHSN